MVAISFCWILAVIHYAQAHVALTFPPARKYALDFLDTFRTPEPCGMKRGATRTTLVNGNDVRITWHLGYPHQGGFKIQLLDANEKHLLDLTPRDLYEGQDNTEQQEYLVTIPKDMVCKDCTIRLERQALEWGTNYRFHSCSDVDIVNLGDFENNCSGHGTSTGPSSCSCQRTYFGERCQYKNDCEDGSDCNGRGRCVDIKGSALPRKRCFCEFGYFGFNCEKESSVKSNNFTESLFNKVTSKGIDFFWRVLPGNEVEGVIVGKDTTSYVAVGWRPEGTTKNCQEFPQDAPTPKGRDFHSMDCTDMVIGTVRDGTFSRVEDYYTRDRSTPQPDSFYGGTSSLTGALGWERDGVTYVMFRKKIKGDGNSDHDFNGNLHFIWAHGRRDLDFYEMDELKYHGPINRGSLKIEVSSASTISNGAILIFIPVIYYFL